MPSAMRAIFVLRIACACTYDACTRRENDKKQKCAREVFIDIAHTKEDST